MGAATLAGIERWYLRTGLFLLPLGFAWDTYDQYALPKLLIARVLLIGLLILFIARVAVTGVVLIKRTPLDFPLLGLLASAAISTFFAENQNIAIFGTYSRYDGLLTLVTYAALFWLAVQALTTPTDARNLLRVLLASGYAVAAVAIVQSVNDSIQQGAIVPAYGSMGNENVLGAFLAMVLALACGELASVRSTSARILVINVMAVVGVSLLLSFSRSAWLGGAVGIAVVIAGLRPSARQLRTAGVGIAALVALLAVVLVVGRSVGGGLELERLLVARGLSLFDFNAWVSARVHIWQDSIAVIASRPAVGYGPDNFGLVFPRFESGDWGLGIRDLHQQVDKAHAEMLQVAATQGILGLAAYLWMLAAFARSFWRGRRMDGALGVIGGFVAYQATIQLNFTALAAAFPFWLLAAAGMVIFGQVSPSRPIAVPGRTAMVLAVVAGAALVALVVPAVVYPYAADAQLRLAVSADFSGRPSEALTFAARSRDLAPWESVYAVETGNIDFEHSDWRGAREAYLEATRLGTYDPSVYRNLAIADIQLGLRSEALAAARSALALDRFDPANQALVAQLE